MGFYFYIYYYPLFNINNFHWRIDLDKTTNFFLPVLGTHKFKPDMS